MGQGLEGTKVRQQQPMVHRLRVQVQEFPGWLSEQTTGPGWSIEEETIGSGQQHGAGRLAEPSSEDPAFFCSSQTGQAGAVPPGRCPEVRPGPPQLGAVRVRGQVGSIQSTQHRGTRSTQGVT